MRAGRKGVRATRGEHEKEKVPTMPGKNRTCNCSFWMESYALRMYDRLLDLGFTLEQIDRRVYGASSLGGPLDKCKTCEFRGDGNDADDDLAPPRVGPTASRPN